MSVHWNPSILTGVSGKTAFTALAVLAGTLGITTCALAKDAQSAYKVVSFDMVWVGEFAKAKVLSPLRLNLAPGLQPGDFCPWP